MEETDDTFRHTYIPKELSKEIVQLRLTQKCTQKEMAHKLNIPIAIYCDMENGKSIYNTDTKNKIQKIEQTYKMQFQHKK
jgi:transcriptional regulator with XRE-family HTH domain